MKRVIAIFLVLTCIAVFLPAGSQADAAAVTEKPFYVLNWVSILWDDGDLALDMPYFLGHYTEGATEIRVSWRNYSEIPDLAEELKAEFDYRSEGSRYIFYQAPGGAIWEWLTEDYVYFHKATQYVGEWLDEFLKEYKRIGGKLDGILTDVEYWNGSAWFLWTDVFCANNPNCYWDIVNNPNYKTVLRPRLEKYGFEFLPENMQDDVKSEIWTMCPDAKNDKAYEIWNLVLNELLTECLNGSVLDLMLKYYPDAGYSDYDRFDRYGWQKHYGGNMTLSVGNTVKAGNVSNTTCYPGSAPWEDKFNTYQTPAAYNNADYDATAFSTVLWKVMESKGVKEADTNNRFNAWVTFYNYAPAVRGTFANTPYYSELMYHLGLLDPEPFIGYVMDDEMAEFGASNPDPDASDPDVVWKVIRELMEELTRVAGYSDRKTILIPGNWNNDFILSGMYANGRNIWRITPDTYNGTTLESFKVEGADPTFYINGQTVTFPQGKIIADSEISKVGSCGYWVETPADVMPVITGDADRYAKDPSFLEDFEGYESGMRLDKTLSIAWDLITGTTKIQDNGGSKALALTGSTTVTNVNSIKNITAGDSFAKQQVWEVNVTVPDSGELIVLRCASKDLGIKIADGKAYYGNDDDYAEIPNVSISAGGTYKIQRKVDFRNADNYTSTYTVYDSTGKVLGSVKNAPMRKVNLPVANMYFSSKKATGTAYIDDYKIYLAGVTTNFTVYDAATGFEVDAGVSRTEDTAYRVSWLNATGKDVVARVYNGDTVISEFTMPAGQDGVSTAIVKAEGNPVLLTVKADVPAEDDDPSNSSGGNEPDTTPNKKDGLNGVTIAIIVVAIFVVCAIAVFAVVIVMMSKKKKALSAGETVEAENTEAEPPTDTK
ncbi:MAG: hypothetical protein IKK11_05460 [Oscillospiraceae bacterium]|nr:hypothetical protein [Oscillospiraceae bacterium]